MHQKKDDQSDDEEVKGTLGSERGIRGKAYQEAPEADARAIRNA